MKEMFDQYNWGIIEEEYELNLDRFYIIFKLNREYDLNFTFEFSNCTCVKV